MRKTDNWVFQHNIVITRKYAHLELEIIITINIIWFQIEYLFVNCFFEMSEILYCLLELKHLLWNLIHLYKGPFSEIARLYMGNIIQCPCWINIFLFEIIETCLFKKNANNTCMYIPKTVRISKLLNSPLQLYL